MIVSHVLLFFSFIDPRELCDYFAQHLGQFKEIYALLEELNAKVSDLLVDTSKVKLTHSK